jgi:hypothetical protein
MAKLASVATMILGLIARAAVLAIFRGFCSGTADPSNAFDSRRTSHNGGARQH